MNMMVKIKNYFLGALLLFSFDLYANKKVVVTSFTIIADMTRNIVGDKMQVYSIARPGAEIHDYSPTPGDLVKAQKADLILWNGLNLERWFKRFLQDIKKVPEKVVTTGITPLAIYQGPYQGKANPHAWMSPSQALIYLKNIADAVMAIDGKNSRFYQKNLENYCQKIKKIHQKLKLNFEKIPLKKRFLVTSEGAFTYLARDYGLQEAYLWPINADRQGTPQQVRQLIETVKAHKIPVVFSESTISDKGIKQVAQETGAFYGGVLYVDSLTAKKGPVPTYLDLLKKTTDTIIQGFQKKP